jgi:hypothetical protein
MRDDYNSAFPIPHSPFLMHLLAQFLLRLAFGLAIGMGITSARQVSSGYFRNHLYVTLGLATLAGLALAKIGSPAAWLAGSAAVLSFLGAALWLYESPRAGKIALWLVALCAASAAVTSQLTISPDNVNPWWQGASIINSGLVLGTVFASMLLGHWYLNAPGMSLEPLKKLLAASAIAVSAQALISAIGTATAWSAQTELSSAWILFVVLRWSFGIFGVLALLCMAWRTLQIPNTQSATGILYVAVIGVFVGELMAALLSAESAIPL